ncbi:radical SAM protein [Candidatus Woesearchaeota archaeon]|nr:radical SAM protein [Candidatus Woesearchaeota archaeon]
MKKVLLVYPPFCTPASPPYSVTQLSSFLKGNSVESEVLDLNLEFHKLKFPESGEYFSKGDWKDYSQVVGEYRRLTSQVYSENNKRIVNSELPDFFKELLKKIRDKKPDVVAFSIVYSSQVFYAYALLKELKEVVTVIGGPAVNDKLREVADKVLGNELELLDCLGGGGEINWSTVPDFSVYNLEEYFTSFPVIPIRTSTTCYYKKCTFCTHFSKSKYQEFPLDLVEKTVKSCSAKHFFLIDDMIPVKRLLELAKLMKPLRVKWACQLKPTAEFTAEVLKELYSSGLKIVIWGVESGSDQILKLMQKGTIRREIEKLLGDSHLIGIKNVVYIMFGFPGERKEEFLETIDLLNRNKENIDLVSSSIFGLQKGTEIYNHPEKFGVVKIIEEKRTLLDPKISYEVSSGLSPEEVRKLVKKYKLTIEGVNKFPKLMNYFREHMLCLS